MFLVQCPTCDYRIECQHEDDVFFVDTCPKCRFSFMDNKCANPECGKRLHFSKSFCNNCGNESSFYLDSYDVNISFIDK